MKYIVLIGDGMADYPVQELGGRTPLEAARTPNMDFIARYGILGRVKTIPDKATPGSDVAAITIFGYDADKYYTGRGPLEAVNLGIGVEEKDLVFRCNLVTVSGDTLVDYSAGHISSKEGKLLMKSLEKGLGDEHFKFYPGISYRNILLVRDGVSRHLDKPVCKPPHDVAGQSVSKNLPKGESAEVLIGLMEESRKILEKHEVNQVRVDLKENPANMIWLWGQGKKPAMPSFQEKYGVAGSVISAVDLIKGLGLVLGLEVIRVPGATGYYDTNYQGKARAAIKSLQKSDFVFVHVEAPDEAGHNGDLREKITAIERFDQFIVGALLEAFKDKQDFRVLVMPDHATPVSVKTHTREPVLFAMYGKGIEAKSFAGYSEREAERSGLYFDKGYELMEYFIRRNKHV
jgi:2,3-bisphosphoglycerate-independent phosphoglycerate mutase